MTTLIKVASVQGGMPRGHVIFVHGLGGHPYSTWQSSKSSDSFWPVWLAQDVPDVDVWTLYYDAPVTNWIGNSLPLQDRATTVLERLLREKALSKAPITFVCHSLGGLVVKQVLRAANDQKDYRQPVMRLLESVRAVVFLGTPHSGAAHATILDTLRLIAWPSTAAMDLLKNDSHLRELNQWYRAWSTNLKQKTFFETRATSVGLIVDASSADAGLVGVGPVPVEADHVNICKPLSRGDDMYCGLRDFLIEEVLPPNACKRATTYIEPRLTLPPQRSRNWVPFLIRLAVIAAILILIVQGALRLVGGPTIDAATSDQIISAFLAKAPPPTREQIHAFIAALEKASATPNINMAIDQAKQGRTLVAQAIWMQKYEEEKKSVSKSQAAQAEAARNIGASVALENAEKAIQWYSTATELDPSNPDGWLGLGDAADDAGRLALAEKSFRRYEALVANSDRKTVAVSLSRLASSLISQGKFATGIGFQDRAIKLLESTDGSARNDLLETLTSRAYRLAFRGDIEASEAFFEKAFRVAKALPPDSPARNAEQISALHAIHTELYEAQDLTSKAIDAIRIAISISEPIARDSPTHSHLTGMLSRYYNLSTYLDLVGDADGARIAGNLAREYGDRAAEIDPTAYRCQKCLAVLKSTQAQTEFDAGNLDLAKALFSESIGILDKLRAVDDSSIDVIRDYSGIVMEFAIFQAAQGNTKEAREGVEKSIALARRAVAVDPDNADYQARLALALSRGSGSYTNSEQQETAQAMLNEALGIAELLKRRYPRYSSGLREVARAQLKMGDLAKDHRDFSAARTRYSAAALAIEQLLALEPRHVVQAEERISIWTDVGSLPNDTTDDKNAASRAFENAVSSARIGVDTHPNNQSVCRAAFNAWKQAAQFYMKEQRTSDAIDVLSRAASVAERFANELSISWIDSLSLIHYRLAEAYQRNGEYSAANSHSLRDVKASRQLISMEPNNVGWRIGYQNSLLLLARGLGGEKQNEQARVIAADSANELQKLLQVSTLTKDQAINLAEAYRSTIDSLSKSDDATDAVRLFKDAMQILNKVAE
ncbi:Putative serine esterase [Tardiphaga sp. OK246]|uniref:tetratricopeptide repeat protein n=1 Tax=Tardiphaga sp. OK246 TaxID=1855307 RepID=UPI000B768EDC|nr:tetratricopeptide repeat protein [Tardiphaga sp. OK246]SNT61629.1 Putative serine esterase [Tardiphaga sp. OK246]